MLDGVSHYQFADSTIPSAVQDADLNPNVTLAEAHSLTAKAIASYLSQLVA